MQTSGLNHGAWGEWGTDGYAGCDAEEMEIELWIFNGEEVKR